MSALEHITQLLGLLAVIQAYEFIRIYRVWGDGGVWTWDILRNELSPFSFLLNEKSFFLLNFLRVGAGVSAMLWPGVVSLGLLLSIHVLTMLRWLGSFNGGSDYMTSLLLLFTWIAMLAPSTFGALCLWYITFQLCLSYFKAGWVKLRNRKWRIGEALPRFVLAPIYQQRPWLEGMFRRRGPALVLSWLTILFELSFPLAVFDRRLAVIYMSAAFLFHLGNAYVFGLNRFVFAWLAAYPALYWCAGQVVSFN